MQLNIFKLPLQRVRLLIDEGVEMLRNPPMENFQKINIYKGITNTIQLSIRNNDRKAVSIMPEDRLVSTFVSSDGRFHFHGFIQPQNFDLGLFTLTIPRCELLNIPTDTYHGSIKMIDFYGNEQPLYLTQDYYPFMDVVVNDNKFESFIPTVEMCKEQFLRQVFRMADGKEYEEFTSQAFTADRTPNHTIMVNVRNFFGQLIIEGTTDDVPSPYPESWFIMRKEDYSIYNPMNKTGEETEGISGNLSYFERANCSFIRIRYIQQKDAVSEIVRVYYRN